MQCNASPRQKQVMGTLHKLLDFSCLSEITANVAHTSATFVDARKKAAAQKKGK